MECKFVAGQKVVCINGKWHQMGKLDTGEMISIGLVSDGPKANSIYTIDIIRPCRVSGHIGLILKELAGGPYDWRGFRPLQDRPKETDISIFEPLLKVKIVETVEH